MTMKDDDDETRCFRFHLSFSKSFLFFLFFQAASVNNEQGQALKIENKTNDDDDKMKKKALVSFLSHLRLHKKNVVSVVAEKQRERGRQTEEERKRDL